MPSKIASSLIDANDENGFSISSLPIARARRKLPPESHRSCAANSPRLHLRDRAGQGARKGIPAQSLSQLLQLQSLCFSGERDTFGIVDHVGPKQIGDIDLATEQRGADRLMELKGIIRQRNRCRDGSEGLFAEY